MPAAVASPSLEEVRRRNLGALLRYVHVHGATTRSELTNWFKLNRSTIGALTADLAAAGLIHEETPRQTGQVGRPSLVVRPESARVYAFALSIEVDRLRAARIGLGGTVLDSRDADRPHGTDLVESIGPLVRFVKEMRAAVPDGSRCVGGGVAVAGMAREADGTVRTSPTDGSTGALRAEVGGTLGAEVGGDRTVLVGDVADVAALAEHTRGAARDFDNVVYLHGDAGIGGGIIAAGRRLTGHGEHGGRVGHMVVNPNGHECGCGSRGCWETEIGESALLRHAGLGSATGRDVVRAVVNAAARGDAAAGNAVRHVADWLGFGVANLVNLFNPDTVVFGGTLREVYLAGAAEVHRRLDTMALPACRDHVRLRVPVLGDDAPLVGAAELAFEPLFADPLAPLQCSRT